MSKHDYHAEPFQRLIVMGESTVEGGAWLLRREERWADVLASLISRCQGQEIAYFNKGTGANAISPRSPGYADSVKPSALERYREDVIALKPDLFVFCYSLNDMRAGMNPEEFREDMQTIIAEVRAACSPVTVLTTVYHMTGYRSFPPFDRGGIFQTRIYNEVIRQLAEANDCLLADVWGAQDMADWLIHPDGVHANAVGNLVIAHSVFGVIAQNCSCLAARALGDAENTDWTRMTTRMRATVDDPFIKTW